MPPILKELVQPGMIVSGILFVIYFLVIELITFPSFINHALIKHDPNAFLAWLAGPFLVPIRFLLLPFFYFIATLVLILFAICALPVYMLILTPLGKLLRGFIKKAKQFRSALRSPDDFVTYFNPLVEFGEKLWGFQDSRPDYLRRLFPDRQH